MPSDWLPAATPLLPLCMQMCLLDRLLVVGEGQGQAGRRQQWARREEEQAGVAKEAQWLEKLIGRNLSGRGDLPSL